MADGTLTVEQRVEIVAVLLNDRYGYDGDDVGWDFLSEDAREDHRHNAVDVLAALDAAEDREPVQPQGLDAFVDDEWIDDEAGRRYLEALAPARPSQSKDPYALCDVCGRKSWAGSPYVEPCDFPQPDGTRCVGSLRPAGSSQSEERLREAIMRACFHLQVGLAAEGAVPADDEQMFLVGHADSALQALRAALGSPPEEER